MTIFLKLLQVAELGRTLSNSCYNVTITQKPTGEDTTKKKKKKLQTNTLDEQGWKNSQQTLTNWIQQFMKESNTMIKLDLLQGHKNSLTYTNQSM